MILSIFLTCHEIAHFTFDFKRQFITFYFEYKNKTIDAYRDCEIFFEGTPFWCFIIASFFFKFRREGQLLSPFTSPVCIYEKTNSFPSNAFVNVFRNQECRQPISWTSDGLRQKSPDRIRVRQLVKVDSDQKYNPSTRMFKH
jgi:hypothetical protein